MVAEESKVMAEHLDQVLRAPSWRGCGSARRRPLRPPAGRHVALGADEEQDGEEDAEPLPPAVKTEPGVLSM
ncbi:unnamed protein product [Arctogadus glacialis]